MAAAYVQRLEQAFAMIQQGKFAAAEPLLVQLVEASPRNHAALFGMGTVLVRTGRLEESLSYFRRAITEKAYFPEAQANLAIALNMLGQHAEALPLLSQVVLLQPQNPGAHVNLGNAQRLINQQEEAVASFEKAMKLQNNFPSAYVGRGCIRADMEQFALAVEDFRKAMQLGPQTVEAVTGLANSLRELGRLDESVSVIRQFLGNGAHAELHSNLLFTIGHHPSSSPEALLKERVNWSRLYSQSMVPSNVPFLNSRDRERRLRIGYVSPDFRQHAVAFFSEGLLANHDPSRFEVVCYSTNTIEDAVTERFKNSASLWRNVAALRDDAFATLVRADEIDVLVDLSGHTAANRLLVFVRQPAPIQVSYLGDTQSSGLAQLRYRLTDSIADPPGMTEDFYTEKLLRLPRTFAVYRPFDDAPAVESLPAIRNGFITFGVVAKSYKLHPQILQTWAEILTRVPGSRLLLAGKAFDTPGQRERLLAPFIAWGIAPERIRFEPSKPFRDYLAMHHEIDVMLDPFPINGHTNTCHALWMGVPVISQAGRRYVSRMGASVLHQIGLTELVADDTSRYVEIATALATDIPRLTALRETMRDRLRQSPLLDAKGFASEVENAIRVVWRQWCDTVSA